MALLLSMAETVSAEDFSNIPNIGREVSGEKESNGVWAIAPMLA